MSDESSERETPLRLAAYSEQRLAWPQEGRHILAQHDADTVVVYQAYRASIAEFAAENGRFKGCPDFSDDRMTWIKTNFLWAMYRSGWASKPNQEQILAIWLKRDAFEGYLNNVVHSSYQEHIHGSRQRFDDFVKEKKAALAKDPDASFIRLQWDPDHTPTGGKTQRRAIQLGLKRCRSFVNGTDIVRIENITPLVESMREFAQASNRGEGDFEGLRTPLETVYETDIVL